MLPLTVKQLAVLVDNKPLLDDINLTIQDSGISLVMGHNGAGKSLLLRCIHGLIKPSRGSIQWSGQPAEELACRKKQSMVFQKPLILNRTVSANITYALKLRDRPLGLVKDYLASAGLESKEHQAARSLSGGEQQRLAIARALATEPQVLFLDEPTANLDPGATAKIESQILSAVAQSIKIIMVTHDVAQARRLADEVLFMHGGSITEHTEAIRFFQQPQSRAAQNYLSAYLR